MRCSGTVLSFALLVCVTASCRYLRPIDPSRPASPEEEAAPSGAAAMPAAERAEPAAAPERSGVEQAPRDRGPTTDANIAAMLLASNNTDISYARLVPARASRDDVKQFAQRMLSDHAGVNVLVNDLMNKLDVTPVDNVASLDMRDESATKRDILRELEGFAFDSTYVENEVSYHRKFLESLDFVMLPRARNADLRMLLTTIRSAVAAHLAHAEQLRADVLAGK